MGGKTPPSEETRIHASGLETTERLRESLAIYYPCICTHVGGASPARKSGSPDWTVSQPPEAHVRTPCRRGYTVDPAALPDNTFARSGGLPPVHARAEVAYVHAPG